MATRQKKCQCHQRQSLVTDSPCVSTLRGSSGAANFIRSQISLVCLMTQAPKQTETKTTEIKWRCFAHKVETCGRKRRELFVVYVYVCSSLDLFAGGFQNEMSNTMRKKSHHGLKSWFGTKGRLSANNSDTRMMQRFEWVRFSFEVRKQTTTTRMPGFF